MTEAQRSSIVKYRKEGLGYKKISKLTGICESTIKTFCHRNGLTGETATMKKASRPTEKACQCCGKPIIQYPRKAMYDFVCPTCGKPFSAYGNRNRKYCSHECYIEARFGGETCG